MALSLAGESRAAKKTLKEGRHRITMGCKSRNAHPREKGMKIHVLWLALAFVAITLGASGCAKSGPEGGTPAMSDDDIENLVRRSYQYVAMYNVNNKFAMKQGGWNTVHVDTELKDHTMREIARPNNDTLYIACMLDLRKDPVILDIPVFGSDYASLMITAYDHYVNVPMTSRLGDFERPEKMLVYSARTEGYNGEPVDGIDRLFEASGDFVSAVFRVMPHAGHPERFERIADRMRSVRLTTLSEYRGGGAKPIDDVEFPPVGATEFDVFENDLLEVMKFVLDHTTFDPGIDLDRDLLATYEPLGIEPGRPFDPSRVAVLDGARLRQVAQRIASAELARTTDPAFKEESLLGLFQPKGHMTLERLLFQSVIGPIGLPASEAVYPAIATSDRRPMNALHDYVIRMAENEMPPATAFWSVTLYETENGFFLPNDRKKYSVGENGGMKLNDDGGIEIYIAASRPPGAPEENWLPINRGDYGIDAIMRVYAPDLERFAAWEPPKAERLD